MKFLLILLANSWDVFFGVLESTYILSRTSLELHLQSHPHNVGLHSNFLWAPCSFLRPIAFFTPLLARVQDEQAASKLDVRIHTHVVKPRARRRNGFVSARFVPQKSEMLYRRPSRVLLTAKYSTLTALLSPSMNKLVLFAPSPMLIFAIVTSRQ